MTTQNQGCKPFVMADETQEGDYNPRLIGGRNRIGAAIDQALQRRGDNNAVAMSPGFGLSLQLKRSG